MANKLLKYQIYPTQEQADYIDNTFEDVNFVYNYSLNLKVKAYKEYGVSLSCFDMNREITRLKNDFEWLRDTDSHALQIAVKHLTTAYAKYFKKQGKYPMPKNEYTKSYYTTANANNSMRIVENKIQLPKLGYVETDEEISKSGRIVSATISKNEENKYFMSLSYTDVFEDGETPTEKTTRTWFRKPTQAQATY
jgi:putative transposase